MGKTNGTSTLTACRQRFAEGPPFESGVATLALAAALTDGFDPIANTTDKQIERFLTGAYGHDWRHRAQPRTPAWAKDAEVQALAAAVEALRLRIEQNRRALFAVRDEELVLGTEHPSSPAARRIGTLFQRRRELDREYSELEQQYRVACGRLHDRKKWCERHARELART